MSSGPGVFTGEGSWQEWKENFEQLVSIEGWDEEKQLFWLNSLLVGPAGGALRRLSFTIRGSYAKTVAELDKIL